MKQISRRTALIGGGLFLGGAAILSGCVSAKYIEDVMNARDRQEGKFLQSLEKYIIKGETNYSYEGVEKIIGGNGIIFNDGEKNYYFTLGHIVDLSEGIIIKNHLVTYRYMPEDFKFSTSIFGVELDKFNFNKKNDVAVFKIPKRLRLNEYKFPLETRTEVYLGERVAILGNPGLKGYHPRIGRITDMNGIKIEIPELDGEAYKDSIGTDISITGGDSGTPIISMEDKKLLGLVGMSLGQGTSSYFQPIKEFLKYT